MTTPLSASTTSTGMLQSPNTVCQLKWRAADLDGQAGVSPRTKGDADHLRGIQSTAPVMARSVGIHERHAAPADRDRRVSVA